MRRAWALGIWLLTACGPLTQSDQLKALDDQIALERKRQELARLQQSPAPAASVSPTAVPNQPEPNQPPRIVRLEAQLRTTLQTDDTVDLLAEATDPDGDDLEFSWASVYDGLSATRGQQTVWFPKAQALAGKSNLISLTVSDKKGGTSTGTLNVYVQADGRLLVKQNLAAQPILRSLEITQPNPGQLRFQAAADDPAGGIVRYSWSASQGLLGASESDTTTWSGDGASGEVEIGLLMRNHDGSAENRLSYRFVRHADGSLSGDFRTIRGAAPVSAAQPASADDAGLALPGIAYGIQDGSLRSFSLRTGQALELARLPQAAAGTTQMLDFGDSLYLLGNGLQQLSLSRLTFQPLASPASPRRLFRLQGQVCLLSGGAGTYQVTRLPDGAVLPLKYPEWLATGAISSQGLVASLRGKTVQVADAGTGVQQDWLDLDQPAAAMAWNAAGDRLAVISGNRLWLLGTDGSRAQVAIRQQPNTLYWGSGAYLLALGGRPGSYQAWAISPESGAEQALNPAVSATLSQLTLFFPSTPAGD